MTEPEWAKVLEVLYHEQEEMYREIKEELSEDHKLVTKAELDPDTVDKALLFLEKQSLIEKQGAGYEENEEGESQSTHIEYTLTEKGFEVAHERELQRRQQELNERQNDISEQMANLTEDQTESSQVVATFTVILVATALVDALTAIVTASRFSYQLAAVYLALLLALLYKQDEWLLTTN